MTCLWPYKMLYFFLTLCFIVAKFCFSSSDYLNAYKNCFYSYSSLMNCYFSSEILCCVFKFETGYQIKAWNIDLIYILTNEN